jgi:hypothetical protein
MTMAMHEFNDRVDSSASRHSISIIPFEIVIEPNKRKIEKDAAICLKNAAATAVRSDLQKPREPSPEGSKQNLAWMIADVCRPSKHLRKNEREEPSILLDTFTSTHTIQNFRSA